MVKASKLQISEATVIELLSRKRVPRSISVETRKQEPFLLLTHRDAVRGFFGKPQALVWYALLYRVWAEKSKTVRVPTKLLCSWGVSRWARWRALTRLEQAGLIQIYECRPGQTARVTLMPPRRRDVAKPHG